MTRSPSTPVAMRNDRREAQLEEKALRRRVIGRAKGMLMAREGVTDQRAFEIPREASERLNVEVRGVAEQVGRGGEADDPGRARWPATTPSSYVSPCCRSRSNSDRICSSFRS